MASTGSQKKQQQTPKSPAAAPALAVSKAAPAVTGTPKSGGQTQAGTPQGKQQQQTSAKKEQAPPAKKQELAKGKGAPTATGAAAKSDKQGGQQTKGKIEALKKAGAKRPLDEDDDDDDEDNWVDDDDDDEVSLMFFRLFHLHVFHEIEITVLLTYQSTFP